MTVAKRQGREHPANVARDRIADAHDRQEHVRDGVEGGRWPNVGRVGECRYCAAVAHAEQISVAAALADIFNPRADYVPRGFGREWLTAKQWLPAPAKPATPSGGKAN